VVDEHGAQLVENVETDTNKPVDSISGPHNSDDEDSSLRRMNTCGLVYRYQRREEFVISIFRVVPWSQSVISQEDQS